MYQAEEGLVLALSPVITAFHEAMFFAYHTEGREVQGYFKNIH